MAAAAAVGDLENGRPQRQRFEDKQREQKAFVSSCGLAHYMVSFGEKCKFLSELEWAGKWRLFEMGGKRKNYFNEIFKILKCTVTLV